jgi:hypothetical protein
LRRGNRLLRQQRRAEYEVVRIHEQDEPKGIFEDTPIEE